MKSFRFAAIAALLTLPSVFFLSACGRSDEGDAFPPQDVTAEKEAYYKTFKRVPVALKDKLERGEITQAEFDAQVAATPLFFAFKTLADVPADLVWENGEGLEEIGSPKAKKGGVYHGAIDDFPRTLRILGPDANGSFRPYILDFNEMKLAPRHPIDTSVDEGGFKHFSGLAKEWAVDKENRTVYVRLDPKARWSDGVPITSDDMVFKFFFMQSKHIKQPWYNNYYTETYSNVTRYDDRTFSIQLAEARPDMEYRVLEETLLPAHFYKDLGDDFAQRFQWRFQPTAGAYVILPEDIKKGQSIALTRQKDWWANDKPNYRYRHNYDKLHLDVIRDPEKAFEAFLRGNLEAGGLQRPEYWYDKLPADDPLVAKGYVHKIWFWNQVPEGTYGLWMNQAKAPLDNVDIREGICYATNWQKVIDSYFRGDATRMNTTAPGYGDFEHPTLKARPFDVEKALESFAKAGFTQHGPDGILVNDQGQRLSFTITTGYRALENVLIILQEEARKAGLEFKLEVLEGTAAWKKAQEKQHEITFSAFGVSPEMYPRYWETYHGVNAYDKPYLADGITPNPDRKPKTQTNNFLSSAYPELDAMIMKYDRSSSVEEMKDLAFRMEEFMHDEAVWSPGFVTPYFRLAKWRWLQYPDGFNVKLAQYSWEYHLAWIDEDIKAETLEAMKNGTTFEPVIQVYDQYKRPE